MEEREKLEKKRNDLENEVAPIERRISILDEVIEIFRKCPSCKILTKLENERRLLSAKMIKLYLHIIEINIKLGVKYF